MLAIRVNQKEGFEKGICVFRACFALVVKRRCSCGVGRQVRVEGVDPCLETFAA